MELFIPAVSQRLVEDVFTTAMADQVRHNVTTYSLIPFRNNFPLSTKKIPTLALPKLGRELNRNTLFPSVTTFH